MARTFNPRGGRPQTRTSITTIPRRGTPIPTRGSRVAASIRRRSTKSRTNENVQAHDPQSVVCRSIRTRTGVIAGALSESVSGLLLEPWRNHEQLRCWRTCSMRGRHDESQLLLLVMRRLVNANAQSVTNTDAHAFPDTNARSGCVLRAEH